MFACLPRTGNGGSSLATNASAPVCGVRNLADKGRRRPRRTPPPNRESDRGFRTYGARNRGAALPQAPRLAALA
jgi:hypothetical protein